MVTSPSLNQLQISNLSSVGLPTHRRSTLKFGEPNYSRVSQIRRYIHFSLNCLPGR